MACGGSRDGGREELRASCWRPSSNCWTVASSAATRAARARIYSWMAMGVCSHSSGGKGGVGFMGFDHTRHGHRMASLTDGDLVNAYWEYTGVAVGEPY